nr:immunoglobulin light chain junction region [Macaca mulatta]MOV79219.1 immunoglobulin light chain junction region [Macaca mulatta]MOV79370.1 immunoglobulin light chain junction region [Macaca mulatta]MOV80017.1 immunoglobulin light chain junction region [Macaca mulatta]MOV81016.1 immunoglobulin light chain junction region [Macaca mulatta]
CQQGSPFPWTF